jgi:hypothetical protein
MASTYNLEKKRRLQEKSGHGVQSSVRATVIKIRDWIHSVINELFQTPTGNMIRLTAC